MLIFIMLFLFPVFSPILLAYDTSFSQIYLIWFWNNNCSILSPIPSQIKSIEKLSKIKQKLILFIQQDNFVPTGWPCVPWGPRWPLLPSTPWGQVMDTHYICMNIYLSSQDEFRIKINSTTIIKISRALYLLRLPETYLNIIAC